MEVEAEGGGIVRGSSVRERSGKANEKVDSLSMSAEKIAPTSACHAVPPEHRWKPPRDIQKIAGPVIQNFEKYEKRYDRLGGGSPLRIQMVSANFIFKKLQVP